MAEAGLAGDRRLHLEERSIKPQSLVQALTLAERDRFFAAVGGDHHQPGLHQIHKYRLRPIPAVQAVGAAALGRARGLEELAIVLPGRDEPHTLNVQKYVGNRLSRMAVDMARKLGAEFFLGSAEELQAWCDKEGFVTRGALGSPSSSDFLYLQRGDEEKIVITKVLSKARLINDVLKLHFAGVDVSSLSLRGDLKPAMAASVDRLAALFAGLPPADDRVCFFGARRQVSQSLQQALHGLPPGNAERIELSAPQTFQVDSFAFDFLTLKASGRITQLIALRMPNGDLAEGAMRALLDNGVGNIVMCGAEGALRGEAAIGDYVEIEQSLMGGDRTQLQGGHAIAAPRADWIRPGARSVTVYSPLEETASWLAKASTEVDCVDVEAAHILRGFNEHLAEHPTSRARIMAGLFVSDIVGKDPLEEKIAVGNAYANLRGFVSSSLQRLGLFP